MWGAREQKCAYAIDFIERIIRIHFAIAFGHTPVAFLDMIFIFTSSLAQHTAQHQQRKIVFKLKDIFEYIFCSFIFPFSYQV